MTIAKSVGPITACLVSTDGVVTPGVGNALVYLMQADQLVPGKQLVTVKNLSTVAIADGSMMTLDLSRSAQGFGDARGGFFVNTVHA